MSSLCFNQERLEHSEHPVSPELEYPAIATPSFSCRPGSSILIDSRFEGPLMENQAHHGTEKEYTKRGQSRVMINTLPEVALLEIFGFYMDEIRRKVWNTVEVWHPLVHVCQKWRNVVFGSPGRLGLLLFCKATTPVRETLDVWPPLPIVVNAESHEMSGEWGVGNILAALEHSDRICQIDLVGISNSQLVEVLSAMQRPFPALRRLRLHPTFETTLEVVPDSFIGGSGPHPSLQFLFLAGIPLPGLPKLLISAAHLYYLGLWGVPHSGYISPEALVTCLSTLNRLAILLISFKSPRSRPDRKSRRPPPLTRTLLPLLYDMKFKGACEYSEDLLARIDAPLLDRLKITFFHQLTFETPQLTQFINRTPRLMTYTVANMSFSNRDVLVTLKESDVGRLSLGVSCGQSDWQLSSLPLVCSSFPQAVNSAVEYIFIYEDDEENKLSRLCWQDDIESHQWLELLHPFPALKGLFISSEFVPRIMPALGELVREGATEVLPTLEDLFLEEPHPSEPKSEPVQEAIRRFVVARQLANHPVGISLWDRKRRVND